MNIKNHLAGYAILGVVILALVTVFGVPGNALLPVVFLACPLMMIFMMRGMDHGGGMNHGDTNDSSPDNADAHKHDHSH